MGPSTGRFSINKVHHRNKGIDIMQIKRRKKIIAIFFLTLLSVQIITPTVAFALTSGPSQPEMSKFQPAGVSDMVDLFTGDLKYNIPLLDVGGYPVNLAYNSGSGMDEEASWVGMGWSLNPGTVNRTMRGLPDDFDGSNGDVITKDYDRKEFKKVGGSIILKPSALGWEFGHPSLKLNVYKDNYYGIGASVGAGVSYTLAQAGAASLTAGLNVNSDVREGATLSPSLSLSMSGEAKSEDDYISASLAGSFNYNSRAGLKDFSLGTSFSTTSNYRDDDQLRSEANTELGGYSAVHYFGQSYTPSLTNDTKNNGYTFNFDLGPSIFGGYVGMGGSGYVYKERVVNKKSSTPAYGYLNYLKGRDDLDALLDFNREKDGPFIKTAPAIAAPVATEDFFMVTGQGGSGQYRPYFNGDYIVYDKQYQNTSNNINAGVTIGGGTSIKLGARVEATNGESRTKKWVDQNSYLANAQYKANNTPDEQPVYFKRIGEKTAFIKEIYNKAGKDATEKVALNLPGGSQNRTAEAKAQLIARDAVNNVDVTNNPIQKIQREYQNNTFSYLTAYQASIYGLDKVINNYTDGIRKPISRFDGTVRKSHHISEITVTNGEGNRSVYGIPVYNKTQQEITFSVKAPATQNELDIARKTGLIKYTDGKSPSEDHNYGRDALYSCTTTPGYATSFLLTAILSPDYVDKTGDGITDDDLGTAVKFNYSKLNNYFKWRAPFEANSANYNEGFISDPKDDKGSIVYGEKEVWYLHSIESKTMIAIFETSTREDGLGVLGVNGGKDIDNKLLKLDKIKLFSKEDWLKNGSNAVPIKVVNFEYDYSLYQGVPNNTGNPVLRNGLNVNQGGKLTLTKVYFTFGLSSRGISNPYVFSYDNRMINNDNISGLPYSSNPNIYEQQNIYSGRQTDRWGTYKQSYYNHVVNGIGTLNNSEFPFVPQENDAKTYKERELADRYASKWQLNQIITPAGSKININYESDDYGYVQNRRAMQMCFVAETSEDLIKASSIKVHLPQKADNYNDFIEKYLRMADGSLMNKLYFKLKMNLDNAGHWEFVSGYAEIDGKSPILFDQKESTATIPVVKINGYSPFSKAGWQTLYSDLPQFAYDNYDNSDVGDGEAAIRSIITSLINLRELFQSPDQRAAKRHFASLIDFNRSMIRLCNPDHKKIGGGARVQNVTISDEWNTMTGNDNATYGQYYDYTTKDNNDNDISSGVAAYEPAAGNEENPFHEPIDFTEKVHWSSSKYHFIEKPFCETYFPAPTVGYSKVTVIPFGNDYSGTGKPKAEEEHTGSVVHEFYTAKDFPTVVDYLPLTNLTEENSLLLRLFTATAINKVAASQGFKIELNDMHGKEKSVKVFNKAGDLVSSSVYVYNVKDQNAATQELDNDVDILDDNGVIVRKAVATDIDIVTDMRESITESKGTSVGAYFGAIFFFFPLPYGAVMVTSSKTSDQYHSASNIKVIQRYGVLKKVITTQNGSTIEAENLLWDERTGEVILTKTQNEYDKYTYAFTYPAYRAYKAMGNASQNLGDIFPNMSPDANGTVNQDYITYLCPGDELINTTFNVGRVWVMKDSNGYLHLIDKDGNYVTKSGSYVLIRSGYRNQLNASSGTVVLSEDPRSGSILNLDDVKKRILDAKAITYKEEWGIPLSNIKGPVCTTADPACLRQFLITSMSYNIPGTGFISRRGIFSLNNNNNTAASFLNYFGYSGCSASFINNTPATSFPYRLLTLHSRTPSYYYLIGGDKAQLGELTLVFDYVSTSFNDLVNSGLSPEAQLNKLNEVVATGHDNSYKYCVYPDSSCGYVLRELVSCTPVPTLTTEAKGLASTSVVCSSPSNCQFNVLLRFHLEKQDCVSPVNKVLNPYYTGVLGNWRPEISHVYTVTRVQKPGNPSQNGGTDIRTSGYYQQYTPFWKFNGGILSQNLGSDLENRWVYSSKSVYFDQKGNEIENVDALKRYGTALFGYQQTVATAVGANARHNELVYDGFEDYSYDLNSATPVCPLQKHFDFGTIGDVVADRAHTGKYSLRLKSGTVYKNAGGFEPPSQILGYDASGRHILLSNELANGFAPIPGKKYLLSLWINDGMSNSNKISGLTIKINGADMNVSERVLPVVEGWKRLEFSFVASASFQLEISSGGGINIDDFRILPNDGQMNSYVYDPMSMRLVAQLDENNFATLYEYDDEGTPIRVKKETERGIMTLKENRQAFVKK